MDPILSNHSLIIIETKINFILQIQDDSSISYLIEFSACFLKILRKQTFMIFFQWHLTFSFRHSLAAYFAYYLSIYLSIYISIYLYLSIYLSVCLTIYRSIHIYNTYIVQIYQNQHKVFCVETVVPQNIVELNFTIQFMVTLHQINLFLQYFNVRYVFCRIKLIFILSRSTKNELWKSFSMIFNYVFKLVFLYFSGSSILLLQESFPSVCKYFLYVLKMFSNFPSSSIDTSNEKHVQGLPDGYNKDFHSSISFSLKIDTFSIKQCLTLI